MKKNEKTNVMRILEQAKIPYESHYCEGAEGLSGEEIAEVLQEDPNRAFKTLVTTCAKTKEYFVFVVPVNRELNLKKAAAAVGAKSIEMIKSRELLPLTGYVHGGCSPIGMKKYFPTTFHVTAQEFDTVYFSAGKIGCQVQVALTDVKKVIDFQVADICD